jgi:hypothetical protein
VLNLNIQYPDNPAFWQQWFTSTIVDKESWIRCAEDLAGVMKVLAIQIDSAWSNPPSAPGQRFGVGFRFHGIYLMLAAYAVENYLKAAIVSKNGWSPSDIASKLPSQLKSHNLLQLAEVLQLTLSAEELELLERAAVYAIWAGRYPVPVDQDGIRPIEAGPNKGNQLTCWRGSDTAVAHCLLEKLAAYLRSDDFPPTERVHRPFDGTTAQMHVRPHA